MDVSKLIESERKKYDHIHSTKAYYGRHTPRKDWFTLDSRNEFIQRTFAIIEKSDGILDVGCGKGAFIDHFSKLVKGKKIVGVDISKAAALARKDINIRVSCASSLPFEDSSFDATYHFDGMEHIPVEIEDKVIDEQFRVARKYIIHSLATKEDEYHDKIAKDNNMTDVHINLKDDVQWKEFFLKHCEKHSAELVVFDTSFANHVNVIIKKKTNDAD